MGVIQTKSRSFGGNGSLFKSFISITFDILNNIGCLNRLTERQISMNENTKQIFCDNAHGVILPYKPGDILYIDGNL